jgi:hypothetical protein
MVAKVAEVRKETRQNLPGFQSVVFEMLAKFCAIRGNWRKRFVMGMLSARAENIHERIDSTFGGFQGIPRQVPDNLNFMLYFRATFDLISGPLAPAICDFVERTREGGQKSKENNAQGVPCSKSNL